MLAPRFLKEKFAAGTTASLWFRQNVNQGAMRGRVVSWDEHEEEMVSYLSFELPSGAILCLPFADIYLSTLSEADHGEALADDELERRAKAINRKQMRMQVEEAENGGSRIARAAAGTYGGRGGLS